MNASREEMLRRIEQATGIEARRRAAEYAAIPRAYRSSSGESFEQKLDLFIDRLLDYGSAVHRCHRIEIAETVRAVLTGRGKQSVLLPEGLPGAWLPERFNFIRDEGLLFAALDEVEGVLTGCAVAIALTGSIVLRHSPAEGRRAITLIPDYHLCVVFEEQVVATVPEAVRLMSDFGAAPLTTISGSSATSDIEMTRIKGVHGPRTLDVILAEG